MTQLVTLLFGATLLASSLLISTLAASPYYDAVVVEGRADSEDQDNETFQPEDCYLPPMAGPCRAGIPMYHFIPTTGKCAKFRWGGCGGNGNRFQSRVQCERKCGGFQQSASVVERPSKPSRPSVFPESSSSSGGVQSCVRSPQLLRCGQGCFISRDQDGCYECKCGADTIPTPAAVVAESAEGNDNRRPQLCELPPVRGHCRALLPRWMYNAETGRCEEFRFGGCDGNGNNFLSKVDCQEMCENKRKRFQDRYDDLQDEQEVAASSNQQYYGTTDYTSAAAKILRFVFQRFWQ